MTTETMRHEFVEFIPEQLDEGVLYISEPYNTAAHKCCCGCGEEVITPLNPTDWTVSFQDDRVSLFPSIGNWSFACRSHYWIRNGNIQWSYEMSEEAIRQGRAMDKELKDRYFEKTNREASRDRSWTAKIGAFFKSVKDWLVR